MTPAERAEVDRLLGEIDRIAHTQAMAKLHEISNIMTVFLGELELAIEQARAHLDTLAVLRHEERDPQ
jgi:hypothetical protein